MDLIDFVWSQLMSLIMDCKLILMLVLGCSMTSIFFLHLKAGSIFVNNLVKPSWKLQKSPIDIVPSLVYRVLQTRLNQLLWIDYDKLPLEIFMQNNGNMVLMHVRSDCRPHLCGGSLVGNYYFVEAIFKWGGSEHLIDSRSFALELQVLHARNLSSVPFKYLTISYLFSVSRHQSLAMQHVVKYLCALIYPNSIITVPSFDLTTLFWPFNSGYYSYSGTYTNGYVTLPTQWYICTSKFHLSVDQLNQFKLLRNHRGHSIDRNSRLPKPLRNQLVQLNEFDLN